MDGGELDGLVRAHGFVITSQELLKAGVTRSGIGWAKRKGMLKPLRQGVYTSPAVWAEAPPATRHALEVFAQQRVHPELVACGLSAAAVLGLPLPSGPPSSPQLVVAREAKSRRRSGNAAGALARRSWLDKREIRTTRGGVRITSAVRTVVDCARELDPPWGLAIADAALERFKLAPERLISAAAARAKVPGGRRALWVAEHARPKVESALESLGRGVIVGAGFPEPTPQVWLTTKTGPFRVDMLDEENRVITEADGKVKYASTEAVWKEKRREDALRDLGFEVIRFTMADYHHQTLWLPTYEAALARALRRNYP